MDNHCSEVKFRGNADDAASFLEEETEKEWRVFLRQLSPFPNSFLLRHEGLSEHSCRKLLHTLPADLQNGFPTNLERARCLNLLALFKFLSGDVSEAEKLTEQVLELEGEETNLVAFGNRAAILWRKGCRYQAKEKVKELERLQEDPEFPYLVVKAKAEQAYSYNRFGPAFYPEAVALFTEVISCGREPEIWQWKFGLALTKRRGVRLGSAGELSLDRDTTELREILHTLMEVATCGTNNTLKAICYAEIAIFLQSVMNTSLYEEFQKKTGLTVLEACEKALELDNDEVSVLWKCGRIFRQAKNLEKSCELLERSVKKRPTTTQCHQLSKTYQAIVLQRAQASSDANTSSNTESSISHSLASLRLMVRSPSREEAALSRSDPFVQKVIDALQQAIDLWKFNIPAVFDLALLYRNLGELDEAVRLLNDIQLTGHRHMRPFEKIDAYEQAGLILKTMSEQPERDPVERQKLKEESEGKLHMALLLCSRLCSKLPGLQPLIKEVWLAFPLLMKAVNESDRDPVDKLREKAKLFKLIRDHRQSLSLLEDIASLAPEEARSPAILKMKVEIYAEEGKCEEAQTFLALLKCTAQGSQLDEFDVQYSLDLYVKAAEEALHKSNAAGAREFFKAAYADCCMSMDDSSVTASSASEDESTSGSVDVYDVMFIYEGSALKCATVLELLFKEVYGLTVTRMDEDCLPGRLLIDYMTRTMVSCSQVVVLTGKKKTSRTMHLLLERAAKKQNTVTFLLEGDHVPKVLKSKPARSLSSELMAILAERGPASHTDIILSRWVQAAGDLFRFLINLQTQKTQ